MTADEYRAVINFEKNLKPGDSVTICWTNCGSAYAASAKVTKINAKSIVAELTHSVQTGRQSDYPAGQKIRVPNIAAIELWSVNNRVEPVGGYQSEG